MAEEDYRNRLVDDDEEEDLEHQQESKPFFQTIIGKIVLIVSGSIILILITYIIANIVYDIHKTGSIGTEEYLESEDAIKLIEKPDNFSLGHMNLNLEDQGYYLSIEVYLAYDGKNDNLRWELDKREHQIVDIVRHILESNSVKDIDSVDERNNILKPKILNSVNRILQKGQLYAVYFNTFTVQFSPVN